MFEYVARYSVLDLEPPPPPPPLKKCVHLKPLLSIGSPTNLMAAIHFNCIMKWKRMSFSTDFCKDFQKKSVWRQITDERIQNSGLLLTSPNPSFVFFHQYLSSNTFVLKSLQSWVLNDTLFHFITSGTTASPLFPRKTSLGKFRGYDFFWLGSGQLLNIPWHF